MKIVSIGGGPAGLFFAILMKRSWPDVELVVHERNRPDDTFGWGVVFSDETLGNIAEADPETVRAMERRFIYWSELHTYIGGTRTVSTGHGFCGMSRRELLRLMHARAREFGVELQFESEVSLDEVRGDADLVVAADGVNSAVRDRLAEFFRPSIDRRKCRFAWFGTDLPMDAFTFIFHETDAGVFNVHAYPFEEGLGTWILECREEVWQEAGLDALDEQESARWCEETFAPWLQGHRILTNRSLWRVFPTIRNERWYHDNVVLLGDAAHTAHFSIGSGTKLAMEDSIALHDAFAAVGLGDVQAALEAYQEARFVEVAKTQKAAQTSLEWFENSARYMRQDPVPFTFNLMTRSKRITYENLRLRDPGLVDSVTGHFAKREGLHTDDPPPPMFQPMRLRGMALHNRVVVSAMCQYSATDGVVDEWHLVHLGSRALGGAALVMTEMTDVTPEGRITLGCAGLWNDEQMEAWRRIVDYVHRHTRAAIGIQLAHAGRKGSVHHPWEGDDEPLREGAWQTLAPSAIPFRPHWQVPKAMVRADMDAVREAFVAATRRAQAAGFDLLELHMAHGYLLSSFLSPASNQRGDEYGGSLENRMRYPLEVFEACRAAWPDDRPISVRIGANDWLESGGFTPDDAVVLARALRERGCDVADVSSGGTTADGKPIYGRMYQVPFAEQIRYEVGMPVMAVGAILGPDHCNTILAAERADLCALARPHLRDPYLTLHAATHYGIDDLGLWPGQYLPGRPPRSLPEV